MHRIRSLAKQFILTSQKTIAREASFMTTSNVDANALTASEHQVQLRRAVIAVHHRDRDRVVRFFPLQHRHRPRLRQAVFSAFGSLGRHARGLRHLCRRLRRAPGRRRHFRALRRPHRPQVDPDRDAAADGAGHLRGGAGPDLCEHRHLGRGDPHRAALHPGRRRRRRMGRLGADVDGMGAHRPARAG